MALVADAIKDCSRRGQIVLDLFAGSGTTLIAAHKTGRCARLIEFDPAYCDQIVRRFGQITGKQVILAATGQSFEVVAEKRGLSTVPGHPRTIGALQKYRGDDRRCGSELICINGWQRAVRKLRHKSSQ